MRELLLIDGHVSLHEVGEPIITDSRQVKVRIAYTAICGYDVEAYKGVISLKSKRGQIGHEVCGIVTETGENVTNVKPGDRVAIVPLQPCMTCANCVKGEYSYCDKATERYSTMMCEYVVIDDRQAFKIDDKVSMPVACLAETLASAINIAQRARFETGGTMVLLGCGGLGMLILMLSKTYPMLRVAVVEPDQEKCRLAKELGADEVWNPNVINVMEESMRFTDNEGFDKVIEASGNAASAQLSTQLIARGGCLVFAALYGIPFCVELNLFELYWKDAQIHGPFVAPYQLFFDAIRMLPRLPLERLITAKLPVEQAEEAFRLKVAGKHAKIVLDWHTEEDGFRID